LKRVLVIPSWYTSADHPHTGVFFQEQAELASLDFDVRLLVLSPSPVGRRRPLSWLSLKASGPRLLAPPHPVPDEQPPTWRWTVQFPAPLTSPLIHPKTLSQLAHQFRSQSWTPDLIHAQSAIPGGQIAQALAHSLQIPYVVTEHQHLIFDYFSNADWSSALAVYQKAKTVAVVSEFQRHMMLMNGVRSPMQVIGNWVDETRFVLPSAPTPASPPNILFIGSTSRLKDHTTFFNAVATLKHSYPQSFSVTVVSPDFQKGENNRLIQLVREQGLDDIVRILPSAGRDKIVQLLHHCTVFVSTSIAETFGVAVCEALMCGKPVVVTASGGVADFVRHGQNGFIAPIGDHASIAAFIHQVLEQSHSFDSETIRSSVLSRFGRNAFRSALGALYLGDPLPSRIPFPS
jgi:glycosyltransferase involved in cell wall biosynthesis